EYGPPASTLTDNGSVYTSRFTGGRNAFEYILPILGIRQKNASLGHRHAACPSCKASSTSSARTTPSGALIEPCIAEPRATPTAPPPKHSPPPTGTPTATTACATTGSTPNAG